MFRFIMYLYTTKGYRLDALGMRCFRMAAPYPVTNGDRVSLAIGGITDVYDPAFQN